jgi:hypothetical protein
MMLISHLHYKVTFIGSNFLINLTKTQFIKQNKYSHVISQRIEQKLPIWLLKCEGIFNYGNFIIVLLIFEGLYSKIQSMSYFTKVQFKI